MAGSYRIRKVGIALAAYSPEVPVFVEQLESIRAQSFRNWICVITLDSPLAPLRAKPRLQPYFDDPRFVWLENPARLGHKGNFEHGIQECAGRGVDAIGCSDQDDVWYPEKVAVSVAALREAGPLSLVHCDMHELRDGKVSERTVWEIERRGVEHAKPAHLLVRNVVAGCAMLMDAELARKFPRIPEGAEFHDHWYALVAAVHGGVHPIRRALFAYRQHPGNVVGVTPYAGVFRIPGGGVRALLEKCSVNWQRSRRLAETARSEGLDLGPEVDHVFFGGLDLGGRLLAMGLGHLADDPALARATIARSVGKLVSSMGH